jgi:hypothetical protein
MLEITLGLTIYSLINCFQFAAGILAKQIGLNFWRWFALFLQGISLVILIFLWDTGNEQHLSGVANTSEK